MEDRKTWQLVAIAAAGALLYHVFVVAGWQADSKRQVEMLTGMYEREVEARETAGVPYDACLRASSAATSAGQFSDTHIGAGWFWDWWYYDCGWTERNIAPPD